MQRQEAEHTWSPIKTRWYWNKPVGLYLLLTLRFMSSVLFHTGNKRQIEQIIILSEFVFKSSRTDTELHQCVSLSSGNLSGNLDIQTYQENAAVTPNMRAFVSDLEISDGMLAYEAKTSVKQRISYRLQVRVICSLKLLLKKERFCLAFTCWGH